MAIPTDVQFDRYAQLENGLNAVDTNVPIVTVTIDGIAIVTKWLSNGIWTPSYDPVTTVWTPSYSPVTTMWTASYTEPSTIWLPSLTN